MITLIFVAGIIAFIAFITVLMVDPADPEEFGTTPPDAPGPVQPALQLVDTDVLQPPTESRPKGAQPAFYEHIGRPPAAVKPAAPQGNRSPYIVDLSGEDAKVN
jgi:hypothetical protein